ncbi:MAG: hypothetical protein LJE93_02015 [Acidobacteria bacterium]|jgi:uncharacterized membrane protein|nr:hypothetical protein [Acidobacteriota bacterium]
MTLTLVVLFSALFVVTHLGLSHDPIRHGVVDTIGEWPFRGLYSVVSFLTLGPAAVLWWQNRHLGAVLWELPFWTERTIAGVLVFFGLFLLFQLLATPSPAGMMPAKAEARGILRVTRHPMNMGLALWGLAHLLANGTVGDIAFFGSFVVVGIIGPYHLDARHKRNKGEEFTEFCKQTSVLPFGAILRGRNRLALDELSFPLALISTAAFVALLFFHDRFFGGEIF